MSIFFPKSKLMHTVNYFLEKLTHTLEKSEVFKTEVLPAVKKININEVLEKNNYI